MRWVRCMGHNSDYPMHSAYATVTLQPSGNRVSLCRHILDMWLDNADDDPGLEPSAIEWLAQ
jgi:hypothetical protein